MIILSEQFSSALAQQKLTGRGYQIVDITLKDGRTYPNALVYCNREVTQIHGHERGDIPFTADQVEIVRVTHKQVTFD